MFPLGERVPGCGARARWLNVSLETITWIAEAVLFYGLVVVDLQVRFQSPQIVCTSVFLFH